MPKEGPSYRISNQQECSLETFQKSLAYKDMPQMEIVVPLNVHGEHVALRVYFTVLSLQPTAKSQCDEWQGKGEIRRYNPSSDKYESVSQLSYQLSTSYEGDRTFLTGGSVQFYDLNWL